MPSPNKLTVQRRPDGDYEAVRPGAKRASIVGPTQGVVEKDAKKMIGREGGGEVAVRRNKGGQIRKQDTVKPGNDPRKSKG